MSAYLTEAKPQGWRALAQLEDGRELLLYLGRSSTQIRAGYTTAFFEVLDDEEREQVQAISLQRWNGAADAGKWTEQSKLTVPTAVKLAKVA
jgi:hypothetical protein